MSIIHKYLHFLQLDDIVLGDETRQSKEEIFGVVVDRCRDKLRLNGNHCWCVVAHSCERDFPTVFARPVPK